MKLKPHEKITKEEFYDEEIAPVLRELAEKCKENGLNFVAATEWEPGEYASTIQICQKMGVPLEMMIWAIKAEGNFDKFMFTVYKYAKEHGHSSMYLTVIDNAIKEHKK